MDNHIGMSDKDIIRISGEIVLLTTKAYERLIENLNRLEKMHTEEYCSISVNVKQVVA